MWVPTRTKFSTYIFFWKVQYVELAYNILENGVYSSTHVASAALTYRARTGCSKLGLQIPAVKTRYRHGLPTHDNKNRMFCIIAYLITKI